MYGVTWWEGGRTQEFFYFDELGDALDCIREGTDEGYECLIQSGMS